MTEQKTVSGLDVEALKRAIENLDFETLGDLYAEDAEVRFVGHEAPPSSPLVLRGREEIAETLREAYGGQDFNQRVEDEIIGNDRLALTVAAQYPDGKRELCGVFIDLNEDGKIARHTVVQAKDE